MFLAFILSSILVYNGYDTVDKELSYLGGYVESNRKEYIQKNIVKGIYLMFLSMIATVYFCFFPWDNTVLKTLAACYVSNDVVGLFCCELPLIQKYIILRAQYSYVYLYT